MSGAGLTQPSPAPRFSSTPATTDGLPIAVGSHTSEVLTDLGYTIGEIGKLVEHLVTPG
jgi:alpha-methylacyl-CoA racemase